MIFERENCKAIQNPTPKVIKRELKRLNSYGHSSFAVLTNDSGSYIQVAGGGVTCLIEKRDMQTGSHYRAWQKNPIVPFEDGTELCFSGGRIKLNANEWFNIDQVIEVFNKFLCGKPEPPFIQWRDITELMQD